MRKTSPLKEVHLQTVIVIHDSPENMPKTFTTSWSPKLQQHAPPETEEVQFDEKWDFMCKKEKHCDENQ